MTITNPEDDNDTETIKIEPDEATFQSIAAAAEQPPPSRRKKVPKGYITQIEWKRDIEQEGHPLSGSSFAVKSPKKLKLSRGGSSVLPREHCVYPDPPVSEDETLPVNIPYQAQIESLHDPDMTESDEDDEMKESVAEYEKSANIYPMNVYQLRKVFSRSYAANRGLRASLFSTRIGDYTRKLAKKTRRIPGEPAESEYRVIFESCFELRYESHLREPGPTSGPLKQWTQIGALYPVFNIDAFNHYYIGDFRVWVIHKTEGANLNKISRSNMTPGS